MTPSLTMNWKMLFTLVANTDGSVRKRGKGQPFFIDSVNHISALQNIFLFFFARKQSAKGTYPVYRG
jgi:hypothetical protein